MFVVLTSKPGIYRAQLKTASEIIESYKYYFYDRHLATFQIAKMDQPGYVEIIEENGNVNKVPTKFLDSFDTLEEAKSEIDTLIRFGNLEVRLEKLDS